MTGTALSSHLQSVEALRAKWVKHMTPALSRQLHPIHTAARNAIRDQLHPATVTARTQEQLDATRDDLLRFVASLYTTVGTAFALASTTPLAHRAHLTSFDFQSAKYQAAFNARIQAYVATNAPRRVDRVLASLLEGVRSVVVPRVASAVGPGERKQGEDDGGYGEDDGGDAIDEGLYGDGDPEGSLDDMWESATDTIVLLETILAGNLGSWAGADALGDTEPSVTLIHTWQSMGDSLVRPTHSDADGQTQLITDPFDVGGDQLMFPTDDSLGAGPEETMYCRCISVDDIGTVS